MINRVEFIVTWACTGQCRHCSVGPQEDTKTRLAYETIAGRLTELKQEHPIESVMCFGGEPLLCPDTVVAIFEEAKAAGIPRRQLITNGFFTKDPDKIISVADKLNACATEILLSVDGFHQEAIPLERVQAFAGSAKHVKLHPAWLVSCEDDNIWNKRTHEALAQFPGLPVTKGNVVFPRGNALKHLREYFPEELPRRSPYDQEPGHVTCISVMPDGTITEG